ncbi:PadR family transcriptional regulator [Sphingomonas oleivorans]|uniref:PadR family transcriptional regulator n=1 Tax=Sphingomonas oleivorans TaxID=1735121 RepID=A0A2T5FZC3_9SPHN|nr:helix-turn-helix transcriptional regulator [Sphingomonas oleivorans]PTQ12025.1 PadR family transcriptional regulator [Sphingomonas oleivorans]
MSDAATARFKRGAAEALRQELRRGTLVLAALAVLREERNGTAVREALAAGGVDIEDGALYPMLRRLEEQGMLTSEWRLEGSRNKRFYILTELGASTYASLVDEWQRQTAGLQHLIRKVEP